MLKIAICDDEVNIVNKIKSIIENYQKSIFEIQTYNSGEEIIKESKNFNIIFLDIDMNGINGIETGKKIREYDKLVKIIYVTNYTDYTSSAFSVHAFGYILKPVKEKEIYNQLDEVLSYSHEESSEILEFNTTEGNIRIDLKDIYYFEYKLRKVIMTTKDCTYTIKQKISEIGKYMEQYGFVMPHKSFSVNLHNVKSVKGYDIYMMDESIIPLSQKKSTQFRQSLNIYLSNKIERSKRG
ncbi:LytTR family DNA-binding domain-containing protein [Romboutsia sedimentorum]|uniref:LytR/AlgR family response regulator transcription factor n=1 Tax=Romboutsia sedimentorum TaxID=1368474 RepID=UPI0024DE14AB|nr:LytTR family DNA-binding domain-containing protein [Romboutsia sedimentorum]MDK2586478.1 LytTR family DNA-binding domain-containing protein [Romboutsia sedimentorum]